MLKIGLALFKMNEKAILKEKTFEGLYLFLREMASLADDSMKLLDIALNPGLMGPFKKEKIEERRQFHWNELRKERIAEYEERGHNLHFDDSDLAPIPPSKSRIWNITVPASQGTETQALLGSPRRKRPTQTSSAPSDATPQPPIHQTRSEPVRGPRGRMGVKLSRGIRGGGRGASPLVREPRISKPATLPSRRGGRESSGDTRFDNRFRPLSILFGNNTQQQAPSGIKKPTQAVRSKTSPLTRPPNTLNRTSPNRPTRTTPNTTIKKTSPNSSTTNTRIGGTPKMKTSQSSPKLPPRAPPTKTSSSCSNLYENVIVDD